MIYSILFFEAESFLFFNLNHCSDCLFNWDFYSFFQRIFDDHSFLCIYALASFCLLNKRIHPIQHFLFLFFFAVSTFSFLLIPIFFAFLYWLWRLTLNEKKNSCLKLYHQYLEHSSLLLIIFLAYRDRNLFSLFADNILFFLKTLVMLLFAT